MTNELAQEYVGNFDSAKSWNAKDVTYSYRRLRRKVYTGIWECNSSCACVATPNLCLNRVAQFPISVKLEVFMSKPFEPDPLSPAGDATENEGKGWGVRALQDIPAGTFICTYAGEMLQDRKADEVRE